MVLFVTLVLALTVCAIVVISISLFSEGRKSNAELEILKAAMLLLRRNRIFLPSAIMEKSGDYLLKVSFNEEDDEMVIELVKR
jgi:hypothetical protein